MTDVAAAPNGVADPAPEGHGHAHEGMPPNGLSAAFAVVMDVAKKIFFMWMMSSLVKSFFSSNSNSAPNVTGGKPGSAVGSPAYGPSKNSFHPGLRYSLQAFISDSEEYNRDPDGAIWSIPQLVFGHWTPGDDGGDCLYQEITMPTPASLQSNGSLYLHVFVTAKDKVLAGAKEVHKSIRMNKYKKHYYKKTANLLTGESGKSKEELEKAETMKYEVLNFWHPNMTINMIYDSTPFTKGSLPSPMNEMIEFSKDGTTYAPVVMLNDYWNLQKHYTPINSSVATITIHLTFQPIAMWKFQVYASQKVKPQWSQLLEGGGMGGGDEDTSGDQDSIKEALLDTNPYLLGITVIVSILHTVFEMLAFKNDIQFWKTRKSLEGLSVRSVLFNIMQSLIVFLYVCDNDTNTMVKFSVGVGLLIECWKIPKVVDVKVVRAPGNLLPRISVADKGSYVESDTKKYDQLAFRYLSWALFPLLVGYAIYSLIYEEQKGWYSYILNMLYGFLLMFGFITMTPQLFINYKLKSVAHLPWRMLTYKFINTFIDDLFAFVIKMPTLYRIGCLRDDVIFFVYLYQRWAYRVDPKRMNEFGSGGEESVPAEEGADGQAAIAAANGDGEAVAEESKKDK